MVHSRIFTIFLQFENPNWSSRTPCRCPGPICFVAFATGWIHHQARSGASPSVRPEPTR